MKLMTHIVAGYPSMDECEQMIQTMSKAGVAFIEIQIPFSDPVADGETIREANRVSLQNGTTTEDCFKLLKKMKKKVKTPLLFMTYYNILFQYGLEKFCKKASEYGAYGLIIPDITFDQERAENFIGLCNKYNLKAIQIVTPFTSKERLKTIAKIGSGFVYCISRPGTTGEQKNLPTNVARYLDRVKKITKLPLALGFGISSSQQIWPLEGRLDIAVLGSKILNLYNKTPKNHKLKTLHDFLISFF